MIGQVLLLAGASMILIAALGVARLGDVLARMHALSQATTLGILLVLVGTAMRIDAGQSRTALLLAAVLQVLTAPLGSFLIGWATYRADGIESPVDRVEDDELKDPGRG